MPVRIVHSKQNARLKELRRAYARPGRDPHGLLVIEGPNLLGEVMHAGLRPVCVFVRVGDEGTFVSIDDLDADDIDILIIPAPLFDSIVQTETPQPVAALVPMPSWSWDEVLNIRAGVAPLVLVLAGLQDPGNLGTILRSAEAFGATGVISLPGTVSPWNPKAIRASAGSIFRVPYIESTANECFAKLRSAGLRILTTAVREAESITSSNLVGPIALLIGNEGNGVPEELASLCEGSITIPTPGPVESLNAAVAASVLLYEAARQRATHANPAARIKPAKQARGPR